MKDTSKTSLHRGHNEGNIRQRTDGRWEVRLSAGIDYKTGKPKRTSTCCNTRQEAIAILQQQAHEVRTQGWRDPMSVTLGEWYEYWLDTYMKDTVKQSTYASYRSYLNKHFCVLGKILLKKLEPHTLQEFYNYKLPAGNSSKHRTSNGQGISTPTMALSSPTSLDTTLSRKLSRITTTAC